MALSIIFASLNIATNERRKTFPISVVPLSFITHTKEKSQTSSSEAGVVVMYGTQLELFLSLRVLNHMPNIVHYE